MTSEEVRGVQLNTLATFADWCKHHDLDYQLAFGSLLGAVRHRGFIPWDDDIDVAMRRPHYERLCREFFTNSPQQLAISSQATDPQWPLPFAKIWDIRTGVSEQSHLPLRAGVGVDVFPIDLVESQGVKRSIRLLLLRTLKAVNALGGVQVSANRSTLKNLMLKIAGPIVRSIKPWRITKALDVVARGLAPQNGELSVLVGPYTWSVSAIAIQSGPELPFEDRLLPAPADPDAVLTAIYGDYVVPPPHRGSHHVAEAHWVN